MRSDKKREHDRYEDRAQKLLAESPEISVSQALSTLAPAIRSPYLCYEAHIEECITSPEMVVLEIGAGTGMFTELIAKQGAQVVATDISKSSLELLLKRLKNYGNIEVQVADMESLPFANESFDLVLSAGSLSYGDNSIVMNEIYRVLKLGGKFICVDSLNHNPIYRFNRWIHYLRGHRTRSTLERMPTQGLVQQYRHKFGQVREQYFGCIAWTVPLLSIFFADETIARISVKMDHLVDVSKSAFKLVMVAEKTT